MPGGCDGIRRKWRRARTLLHHIELDKLATEDYLEVNPQRYLRKHHEWLERVQANVESEIKELEWALRTCMESENDHEQTSTLSLISQ
jgi:hypothetical protein